MGPLTDSNKTVYIRGIFDSNFLYIENQYLFLNFFDLLHMV